jgi:hypothetical protein
MNNIVTTNKKGEETMNDMTRILSTYTKKGTPKSKARKRATTIPIPIKNYHGDSRCQVRKDERLFQLLNKNAIIEEELRRNKIL